MLFLGLATVLCQDYGRLRFAAALFPLALSVPLVQAWRSVARATFPAVQSATGRLALRLFTATLYILQPIARLSGRVQHGLAPWRKRAAGFCAPRLRQYQIWSEAWQAPTRWLEAVEEAVRVTGGRPLRGGDFDRWDLEVTGGLAGSCRLRMAVEEHGAGRQLIRLRCWPRPAPFVLTLLMLFAVGAIDAEWSHAIFAAAFLGSTAAFLAFHVVQQCGAAMAAADSALRQLHARRSLEIVKQMDSSPPRVQWEQPPNFSAGLHVHRLQQTTAADSVGPDRGR